MMMMMMESNDVYIALDTAGLARRGAADCDRKWAEKLHILSSSLSLWARVSHLARTSPNAKKMSHSVYLHI